MCMAWCVCMCVCLLGEQSTELSRFIWYIDVKRHRTAAGRGGGGEQKESASGDNCYNVCNVHICHKEWILLVHCKWTGLVKKCKRCKWDSSEIWHVVHRAHIESQHNTHKKCPWVRENYTQEMQIYVQKKKLEFVMTTWVGWNARKLL